MKGDIPMKKIIALVAALVLTLSLTAALADTITIAVPNDPTNEGRALNILQDAGIIKLKDDAGITATKEDIVEFVTAEIEFYEVAADVVPSVVGDVDYAIINGNYALDAGIDPKGALLTEKAIDNPYINVISVKEGNENSDAAKALAAAATSQKVLDYINEKYNGVVVIAVENVTDGYDATVDYEALKGTTISIAATPVPHEEILKDVVAPILAEKGITLEVKEVTDYVTPNQFVEAGDVFANYFAHQPYQDSFNAENGTHLVTIAGVHVEPMGLYAGKQADLSALGK
jgi:D-methionine transport system substrate-binding protein